MQHRVYCRLQYQGKDAMRIATHISALEKEARAFADAAELGGLDVDIESCPGWTMRDLVRHLSEIHLWAAAHVATRATKMWVDDLSDLEGYWPELAVFWPDDDELVEITPGSIRLRKKLLAEGDRRRDERLRKKDLESATG